MDGMILVKKEKNMTSHDVVNRLRRILGMRKIGHSGTLDPNVEGVLCVFLGNATKAMRFMEDKSKQYRGVMKFGAETTTEDSDGEVVHSCAVELPLNEDKLCDIFKSMLGKSLQQPPMVSSVKVNGRKLYEYFREGIEVERPVREIEITNFELVSIHGDEVEFIVDCSQGTYVRTICVDVARKYGTLGHMKSLTRTRVGVFPIEQCSTLEQVANGEYRLYSVTETLSGMPCVYVDDVMKKKLLNGKSLYFKNCKEDLVLVRDEEQALAVYIRQEGDLYKCERGLW